MDFALLLMVVGMITVFLILLIVIELGTLLIRFVNTYFPEEEPAAKPSAALPSDSLTEQIIAAAVQTVTKGKGHVQKIEKI